MRGSPDITVRDHLLAAASDYAIRAEHETEIAETGDLEARAAAIAFSVVECVLREVAEHVDEVLAA